MIIVIDNYDSFVYNLVQYISERESNVRTFRNDAITLSQIEALKPNAIVISPGPGNPSQAGISVEAVKRFSGNIPILGVCLGHQCIGQAFGGRIIGAKRIMHGKTSDIYHDGKGIFKGIPKPFEATRYHSLVIDKKRVPKQLVVSAKTKDGEIMGVRHRKYDVEGIQFHPESILTKEGKKLIFNFVSETLKTKRK